MKEPFRSVWPTMNDQAGTSAPIAMHPSARLPTTVPRRATPRAPITRVAPATTQVATWATPTPAKNSPESCTPTRNRRRNRSLEPGSRTSSDPSVGRPKKRMRLHTKTSTSKLSKQQVEQLLNALQQKEKEVEEKMNQS